MAATASLAPVSAAPTLSHTSYHDLLVSVDKSLHTFGEVYRCTIL